MLSRLTSDYGMVFVLLALCAYYSYATWDEQHPTGAGAAEELAAEITTRWPGSARVLILARGNREDVEFADLLQERLRAAGKDVVATVTGTPADARKALQNAADGKKPLDIIACNDATAHWDVLLERGKHFPGLERVPVVAPTSYPWPNFLKPANLVNVANQIAIIAILAVGMTLVVFTGGIDLSVGSLIALSAVVSTLLIRDVGGGEAATAAAMIWCCLGGIAVCALIGLFSGVMVTSFDIPPFIVTLSMMLIARGLANEFSDGESIYQVPEAFVWLGRGADLFGIPNQVVLMIALYALAHILMTYMTPGRYIYAVGGNPEAARLSGVPVRAVTLFVYALCGALAGVGGVVLASQLKSGSPRYGDKYELTVIAAVVVGGASLRGGQGKVLSTLIGALILAVMQNGMNLTHVTTFRQDVVLGAVILLAVVADTMKRRWRGNR